MKHYLMLIFIPSLLALPTVPTAQPSDPLGLWNHIQPVLSDQVIDPDYNIPEVQDAPEIPFDERDSPTHAYSVDIAFHTTPSDMECLREKGYHSVFVRALNPIGNTYFDSEVLNTINNAYEAGLGSEVYITPNINSTRSGADQISLVYQNLRGNGINVRSIWIQVTSPSNWEVPMAVRINFIQDMIQRAKDLGLSVGIYTSFYDWLEITGGWNTFSSDVFLWYWHVLGVGADGETNPTLEDFRPFGPWRQATVKQFGQVEKVCGMIVNRNVYATRTQLKSQIVHFSNGNKKEEKTQIRVGGIGF
ncbi:CBN-LYS-3 protein [Caenorhabditis brenneri]|uniref:CBN-LYS-3 protein n=1 Tax=Caenorhabditis brenneri TaxID=135651 RepID=G0N906_CAEBE|nr:CBN-LYS-3 protein [Caenorhabditis brenneri]